MDNKILKLHNTDDNSVIIVFSKFIVCIDTIYKDGKNCGKIYISAEGKLNPFTVNETAEKIWSMIKTTN